MDVKFNMFELEMDYNKEKEVKETNKLTGIDLKPKIINTKIPIRDNIYWNRLLTIPKVPNMSYLKVLLKCTSNLYDELVNGLDKNQELLSNEDFEKFNKGEGITKDGIHIELRHFFAFLGGIVQYTINSSSYRQGEFYGFDAMELSQKLRMLQSYCDNRLHKEDSGYIDKEPSFEFITTDMLNRDAIPFHIGSKLGASIDDILDKIKNNILEKHNRFFYLKNNEDSSDNFYFYKLDDLK